MGSEFLAFFVYVDSNENFIQSIHTDCNDKVSKSFQKFVLEVCDSYHKWSSRTDSTILDGVCNYLVRYRKCMGNNLGLTTVCCWKALRNETLHIEEKNSFLQYFCCESLGFSMDISSATLEECGNQNCYGASFQSNFIKHGTSFPICICPCDETISCSQTTSMWIPFAWGRSGGSNESGSNSGG